MKILWSFHYFSVKRHFEGLFGSAVPLSPGGEDDLIPSFMIYRNITMVNGPVDTVSRGGRA